MVTLLEILAVISLWLVLVSVVVWVDPAIIRDVLVPGVYLPMHGLVLIVLSYTLAKFLDNKMIILLVTLVLTLIIGALLIL